jgi:hypothetical protein
MASPDLEDVPSLDLMHELFRRMKCSSKPDKHLILVGPFASPLSSALLSPARARVKIWLQTGLGQTLDPRRRFISNRALLPLSMFAL